MSLVFRVPEGRFMKGPGLSSVPELAYAFMTLNKHDLGPVLFLARTGSDIPDGAGRFQEYFSPGRDPETNRIEFHRLHCHYPNENDSVGTFPGLEGKFVVTRNGIKNGQRQTVTLSFPHLERQARLSTVVAPHDRGVATVTDQLVFQSQFRRLPNIYQLFALVRKGFFWLAFARERYNPTQYQVLVGKPNEMRKDNKARLEGTSKRFMTTLGLTNVSPQDHLKLTHDTVMLLTGPNALPPPNSLERLFQESLRPGLLANPDKFNPLSPEERDGLEFLILGALGLVTPNTEGHDLSTLARLS